MDRQYKVGIVGATGMVGQRFVTLLENHPWFKLTVLAASGRSAGKSYEDAVGSRWAMTTPMPESVKKMTVLDASKVEEVASQVDFVFCAVNMPKDEIKALEEAYAKAECPVVSNNSAHRFTPDVPMVVPEINADHIEIIPAQRKRLGTKRGFIAVKSNCSLQSYVPALHPLMKDFGVSKALVCTYQAISGAGKTFATLSQEEQKYANIFLHDIQSGAVVPQPGKTLREYIAEYIAQKQNDQIHKVAEVFGLDEKKLRAFMRANITEANINEFGRFDDLKATVDKAKAKAYFEAIEGTKLIPPKVPVKYDKLLREFIVSGGFDLKMPKES